MDMQNKAETVARFLSGLASAHRLNILCQLAEGEKHVSELIALTHIPQTSMSQHLSKLKKEGIVDFRREHRTLYYFISHPVAAEMMTTLHKHFCTPTKG